jgi:hypothetical protein
MPQSSAPLVFLPSSRTLLITYGCVVQGDAHDAPVMAVILPYDALAAQLPQPRVVVATCCDQIRAVCTEGAVPDPALVAVQRGLERESRGVAFGRRGQVVAWLQIVRHRSVEGPDAGGVVGGTSREVADVGGEEDAGDVGSMGSELAYGDDGGGVVALDHAPDIDVALAVLLALLSWVGSVQTHSIVPCAHHAAVRSHRHTGNADIVLGNQLVAALVLTQVPDAHVPASVTANQLALVRMDHHVVDRHAVGVVPLHVSAPCVPYLNRPVLGAGHEPLGLAVECDARDVGRVPVKGEDGIRVGRLDVVELDRVVARGGQVALVGRDAQAVHLRVGVGDGAGADAAEGLPKAVGRGLAERIAVVLGIVYRIVWS